MNKQQMIYLAVAVAAGFFLAGQLAAYPGFSQASSFGLGLTS